MTYRVGRCLLRERLRDADLSQIELAEKLNVTKQQINKYTLDGRVMSLQTAKNIASILNCQMDDLYEWIEVGSNE